MRLAHSIPGTLAIVALSATVGMLSLDRDAASTPVSTERAVSTIAPSIAPSPTMTITAPAEPVEREAVDSLPAPTPTAQSTAPAEPLCDPEITDLHCDPETGEYWDVPEPNCGDGVHVPEGILSEDGESISFCQP